MAIVMSASKLTELLRSADEHKNMYVRVLSPSRLALGIDPDRPTLILDLSKEKIAPYNRSDPDDTGTPPANELLPLVPNQSVSKLGRRSGIYWFEVKGKRVNCRSLKELLSKALRALETAAPDTLEKLSNVKPRSRRIVARDPHHLFDKGHLTEKYAERLIPGWWYGTNNSANETEAWLKHACVFAGFKWESDFSTSLAHRERREAIEGTPEDLGVGERSGQALVSAMRASPHRDIDIEPRRVRMPVRDIDL